MSEKSEIVEAVAYNLGQLLFIADGDMSKALINDMLQTLLKVSELIEKENE